MTNHKKFSKVDLIQLFGRATLVCGLLIAGLMYWLAPKAGSPHPAVVNSVSGEPSAAHERRQVTPTGTPGVGTMPIEQIRVGDRVLAHNPEVGDAERRGWAEPDWGNWLHLSLEMPLPTEGESDAEPKILSIEILRPESWLRGQIGYVVDIPGVASTTEPTAPAAGLPATVAASPVSRSRDAGGSDAVAAGEGSFPLAASSQTTLASHSPNPPLTSSQFPAVPLSPLRPIYRDVAITSAVLATEGIDLIGLTVDMDLPEMGAFGTAVLTDIRPCPPVGSGDGQPVTATFSHPPSTAVLNVVFAGESEPIGVTDNHQFWSVDDEQFKPIGEMAIGEQVQTYQGETKRIAAKLPRPGPQTVYNLEVYGEHVYFVGEQGLLAHNMCQAPKGGFALPGGSSTGGSFGRSSQVLDEIVDVAQSQRFVDRARGLGFSDDAINALPNRLRQYGDNVGETFTGGWADADQFLVGRWGVLSTRNQRIMHELGHVLDDVANPGLFSRSGQAGFGWRGFYNAERVAYTTQYGFNPAPLTAFNATAQAYPIGTRVVVIGGTTYAVYEWLND